MPRLGRLTVGGCDCAAQKVKKILIRGTPLFVDVPLANAHVVLAYRDELISIAHRTAGWWDSSADQRLFGTWNSLYQEIAQRCQPQFDPAEMGSHDRHCFFVAQEPIEILGQWSPGLSTLDQILGYSYPDPATPSRQTQPPIVTTENPILDLVVDTCLVFKQSAPWLLRNYGVEEVRLMLVQGNDRLRGEEGIKERSRKHDLARVGPLAQPPGAVDPLMASLAQFGITPPAATKKPPPGEGEAEAAALD